MIQTESASLDSARALIAQASDIVWGPPMLVLFLGTGLYLTILLRGLQFRELGHSLYLALIKRREHDAEGDISHFEALMTALAATVGTGNIAGVAAAIAVGGPGALFWMWMTGLVGMATKYAEAVLGVRFRVTTPRGEMAGGPMYYLSRGIGGPFGSALGWLFAVFAMLASFGIGNMVQANSVADALQSSFGVPPVWSGLVMAGFGGAVIIGGIRWIGKVTAVFVPVMILTYILGGLVVLAINWRGLPAIFTFVIADAFRPAAAAGGFLGATLMTAVRMGVARGVFSNESGLGTGAIAAAAAQTHHPVTQALVSMTQTFIDTIIVCSITGFTIIATGAWMRVDPATGLGYTGAPLTAQAFRTGLPGSWGDSIVAIGLAMFAFSTVLGWSYYGERNVEYLMGSKAILPYRILFTLAVFAGAWAVSLPSAAGFELVWGFSDVTNGAMALPNLIGLLVLSPLVAKETRGYLERRREGLV